MKMNPHRTEWHVQDFEQYILDWRNRANALIELHYERFRVLGGWSPIRK
jgi:3'-phosphoadenosine 5'-phosphosulfate sulfotransferase (PAPS reductase)/FAD synthetase